MNELTAQLALDPPGMGEVIHDSEERNGYDKSDECGEVKVQCAYPKRNILGSILMFMSRMSVEVI